MLKHFLIIILFSIILLTIVFVPPVIAAVYHHGYTNKYGTRVLPYHQSSPNSSIYDNYSTKGNKNPYTGKSGTVNPITAILRKLKLSN